MNKGLKVVREREPWEYLGGEGSTQRSSTCRDLRLAGEWRAEGQSSFCGGRKVREVGGEVRAECPGCVGVQILLRVGWNIGGF